MNLGYTSLLGKRDEGGKKEEGSTEVDKMTPKGGQNGTKMNNWAGIEGLARRLQHSRRKRFIAIGKELATSDAALLNRKSNSSLRSPHCEHFVRFTSGTLWQQLLQTANNARLFNLGFRNPKKDDEARKFRRLNYDTCNVS